jgi:hypothetical protein
MPSHQTIQLCRGAHVSPDKGVCVMELASMLAGEKFSDRPRSVSPVLCRFLRAYNDLLDDDRRQDLYPIASRVVGSAASKAVECSRAERCIEWIERSGHRVPWTLRLRPGPPAGSLAAKTAAADATDEGHRRALALVDELISFGDSWAGIPADPGELIRPGARITGR